MNTTREMVIAAKRAGRDLRSMREADRKSLLSSIAASLTKADVRERLNEANGEDLRRAQIAMHEGKLSSALVARLRLNEQKLDVLIASLRQLAHAPDCVNQVRERRLLDEHLVLERKTCPLGVLGVVFEARPDAIPQIAGLALKTGNAVVLKGGSEALNSNRALVGEIHRVLEDHGMDPRVLTLLEDRSQVRDLLELDDCVDLIVARGSGEFVQRMQKMSKIPVMGHAEGLCHIYVHEDAEPAMAAAIVVDSKCTYPAACNAVETLLWHSSAHRAVLLSIERLIQAGVELQVCEKTWSLLQQLLSDSKSTEEAGARLEENQLSALKLASQADFSTEYCAMKLSIMQVDSLEEALDHIEYFGSKHTESIVTESSETAATFLSRVDAACVFHNASTRFSDGYRMGLGAEVGVSTSKMHARGPVGVEGLLSYRWLLHGSGQLTADYGPGDRKFLHRDLPTTES